VYRPNTVLARLYSIFFMFTEFTNTKNITEMHVESVNRPTVNGVCNLDAFCMPLLVAWLL